MYNYSKKIQVAFSNFIALGLSSWMPTYLVNERGLSLMSSGYLQMFPAVTGLIFVFVAGQIVDRLKNGREKWLGAFSGLMLGLMVYLMFNAETITGIIICQSITYYHYAIVEIFNLLIMVIYYD